MKTIYKYALNVGTNTLYLPKDAQVLSTGVQNGRDIVIWAIVDTEDPLDIRYFDVYVTGTFRLYTPVERLDFIGTIMLDSKEVVHVFEVNRRE